MRGIDNSLIELFNSWILLVILDIGWEPVLEVNIWGGLRASLEQLSDSKDASNEVEWPLSLAIILGFQIVGVLSVDILHLLNKSIQLAHHDVLADHEEPVHETQALLLHVLVAVLESI